MSAPAAKAEVAKWLKDLRESAGQSQREAAIYSGADKRTVRRYENGDVPEAVLTVLRLLELYGALAPAEGAGSAQAPALEPVADLAAAIEQLRELQSQQAELQLRLGPLSERQDEILAQLRLLVERVSAL